MVDHADREFEVLESIYNNGTHVRQRDLASILGLSLGMTNAIIKRLAQKGWLTIRKVNNRNIRYAVSSAGAEEIAKRSYRYLRRTIKNVVDYKETIERLVALVAEKGFEKIVLVGTSDIDFVVEHLCGKQGLGYIAAGNRGTEEHAYYLYSERIRPEGEKGTAAAGNAAYLRDILV